jgi:homoserine kinase type II
MRTDKPAPLAALSRQWGIRFTRLRPDLPLAGSPERTLWRSVVETDATRLFVLEKIPSRMYARKRQIINTLKQLGEHGLSQIAPYRPDACGETIPLVDHGLWQLCPFVPGIDLERPAYAMHGWRGEAAAAFLTRLHGACSETPAATGSPPFSIAAYSRDLYTTLGRKKPEIAATYRPFIDHLNRTLFPIHDRLPAAFCHGDYHPLNIIWGQRSIRAVIDWEFCGTNPEIYDLANLLGCLGMEDPESLGGAFVQRLISRLRRSGIYSDMSWKALPDLMLAIRFAWLSEWMRKRDLPMIRMEADYMALLLAHGRDFFNFFPAV